MLSRRSTQWSDRPNRTLLLVSGGERAGDAAMLEKARQSMEAGATGLIFGRNVWQRVHEESLRFA
ncbi:MAG TPA: hypothetical protein VMA73_22445, partial [Streptosporangiaceae bacterium]|nr:hypothetical protein [Streptosporangiaceae bacterium]